MQLESEVSARRFQELEGKYESALVLKEKLAAEIKTQRDLNAREVEILKNSENLLKKSIEGLQTNYNQLLMEMFELKVESYNPQYCYDEVFCRLESFKKEVRKIDETSALKSKTGKSFKKHNEELESRINYLEKQNGSLEMQLMESNMLMEQYETRSRILASENEGFRSVLSSSLSSLDCFLQSKQTVEQLNKEIIEENEKVKSELANSREQLRAVEASLKGQASIEKTHEKIREILEEQRKFSNDDMVAFSDMYAILDTRLADVLEQRMREIKEASEVVKEDPNEGVLRKNKMMGEDIIRMTEEMQKLRMEISDLKRENSGLRERAIPSRHKNTDESATNMNKGNFGKNSNCTAQREPSVSRERQQMVSSPFEIHAKRPEIRKNGGVKFCNECGGLIKKSDKSVKCLKCEVFYHTKCASKFPAYDQCNFICNDCN